MELEDDIKLVESELGHRSDVPWPSLSRIIEAARPKYVRTIDELLALTDTSVVLIHGNEERTMLLPFSIEDGYVYGPMSLVFEAKDILPEAFPLRVAYLAPEDL